ncbi:MAG: hypothetical protein H6Q52_2291, partial [Deltaproteobacteria bacterium]|nr:hypothetical protein [Deltaproteobacteria bacterium]
MLSAAIGIIPFVNGITVDLF